MTLSSLTVRVLCAALLTAIGCSGPKNMTPSEPEAAKTGSEAWLVDEAALRGVDFLLDNGYSGRFAIPETFPGGVALLDADSDGDLDLYLVQAGSLDDEGARSGNRLYRNDGHGFFDVVEFSGAEDTGWGIAAATGDADGDGIIDLYVSNLGADRLFRGLGDCRFEDVTVESGLNLDGFSTGAGFADLDGDGDQDLVVLNYIIWSWAHEAECYNPQGGRDYCAPSNYAYPESDHLFENLGDLHFKDISEVSGFSDLPGTALGIAIADISGDSLPDIVVSNDRMPDRLWLNQGGLRFFDEALLRNSAIGLNGKVRAGMGVDLADLDHDDDLDQLVVHIAGEADAFLRNDGSWFSDQSAVSGVGSYSRPRTRFSANFADFDHDGRLDLMIATGRVEWKPERLSETDIYAEPNLLLRGVAPWRFEPVEQAFGPPETRIRSARGIALGDIDGDGDLDAVVSNHNERVSVLINQAPKRGESIIIDIRGSSGGPALGAVARLEVGGQNLRLDVRTTRGFASASDHRLHIGLGDAEAPRSVEVTFSNQDCEVFELEGESPFLLKPGSGLGPFSAPVVQ